MAHSTLFLLPIILSLVFTASMAISAPSSTSFVSDSCKATLYPTECVNSLSPYSNTIKKSPLIMAQTALFVAQSQAQSGKALVAKLIISKEVKSDVYKALDVCLDQLDSSADLLSQSVKELKLVGPKDNQSVAWRISNVQTWVSAALTDQDTCLEAFTEKGLSGKIIDDVSSKVTAGKKATSNSLALVNKVPRENAMC